MTKNYKKRRSNKIYAQLKKAGVEPLDAPGKILFVSQSSVLCGVSLEQLEALVHLFDVDCKLIVYPTSKSYSFVVFSTLSAAEKAYERLNDTQPGGFPQPLQLVYVDRVPVSENTPSCSASAKIDGLRLLPDFISEANEASLVEFLEHEAALASRSLKNRLVFHYGYAFDYSNNTALQPCSPIPPCLLAIFERAGHCLVMNGEACSVPDQVTVNVYEPGQGIPPHVDTHSAFEESILSLSLLSPVVMEFRDPSAPASSNGASVLLPRRSLLVMQGAARYRYKHGILGRKYDVSPLNNRLMARGRRISVTYRRVRRQPCQCPFPEWCDWERQGGRMAVPSTSDGALEVEAQYVEATYASIAHHFDETRVANWSAVGRFLDELDEGALLLDAGCGNGKYLLRGDRSKLVKLGCDLCEPLVRIAKQKSGSDVAVADLLQLPYRDGAFDACLCIAVLHHLSTDERRLAAVTELVRLLKRGARAIVTVWAMEQRRTGNHDDRDGGESVYARMKSKKGSETSTQPDQPPPQEGRLLRIHEGGADFKQQDLLIPWHLSSSAQDQPGNESSPETRYRYYHLFIEGELESLIAKVPNCKVTSTVYEEGNWIAVLERT